MFKKRDGTYVPEVVEEQIYREHTGVNARVYMLA